MMTKFSKQVLLVGVLNGFRHIFLFLTKLSIAPIHVVVNHVGLEYPRLEWFLRMVEFY